MNLERTTAVDVGQALDKLVEIGQSGNFLALADLPKFQDHRSVCSLADEHRNHVVAFARALAADDLIAFVKAVAMLEHSVGGLGSVTNLRRLLPLVPDRERHLLDWILRNTNSYWYYAHSARSVEEFDRENTRRAARTAERAAKDRLRQVQDRKRIAEAATRNLYNAVRRGDIKSVQALISKGADVMVLAPDGSPLVSVAKAKGFESIADELRRAAEIYSAETFDKRPRGD
ncbi:MAG: hypothetical protein IPH39_05975 [Sulfuritalea sp.]|nr:hypothetical protein [Sulfuritalea sp.]